MKTFVPDYYPRFRCIADRCRHNCCIGWEIDIDEDTYRRYRKIRGSFAARLQEGIDHQADPPCFRLGEGERCVFLNDQGLCDIIATLGEDALCDICREHPRYRNAFSDRTEVGLGLCCEEACRLILEHPDPVRLICVEDDGGGEVLCEEEMEFLSLRERLMTMLQDRRVPFSARAAQVSALCGLRPAQRTPAQWAAVYRDLERMDTAWDAYLDRLAACTRWVTEDDRDTVWEQLAVYLLLRHTPDSLDDGLLAPRVAFCLHAVTLLRTLAQGMDMPALRELCRLYSCEIEYSEENTEAIILRQQEDA